MSKISSMTKKEQHSNAESTQLRTSGDINCDLVAQETVDLVFRLCNSTEATAKTNC